MNKLTLLVAAGLDDPPLACNLSSWMDWTAIALCESQSRTLELWSEPLACVVDARISTLRPKASSDPLISLDSLMTSEAHMRSFDLRPEDVAQEMLQAMSIARRFTFFWAASGWMVSILLRLRDRHRHCLGCVLCVWVSRIKATSK